jgi:hypothetical protein
MNHSAITRSRLFQCIPRVLPATLVIGGVALAVSTACYTYTPSAPVPYTPPPQLEHARIGPDLSFLHRVHTEDPGRAVEPSAIAAALLPVVPLPAPDGRRGAEQLDVTWVAGQPGKPEYRIEAFGDFNPDNAQEFLRCCAQVRRQLPPKAWLIVYVYRDPKNQPGLIAREVIE